jgi:glycosyltransferase involved in cell wall biosynthesis
MLSAPNPGMDACQRPCSGFISVCVSFRGRRFHAALSQPDNPLACGEHCEAANFPIDNSSCFVLPDLRRFCMEPCGYAIDSVLRFGNYFVVFGSGHFEGHQLRFEFPHDKVEATPEYSFIRKSRSDIAATNQFESILMFWIDDGYKLTVGSEAPLRALYSGSAGDKTTCSYEKNLFDYDFEKLRDKIEQFDLPELWSCSILWEIVSANPTESSASALLSKGLRKLGWNQIDLRAGKPFYEKDGMIDPAKYLRFQSLCIPMMDEEIFPLELVEGFSARVEELDLAKVDTILAGIIISRMQRIGARGGYEFVQCALDSLPINRRTISALLCPCLPQSSRWWIDNVLKDESIGAEQAADALNALAAASHAQNNALRAEVFFKAASKLHPQSQSSAWNAGQMNLADGKPEKAREYFEQITRFYASRSICTLWPESNGKAWPYFSLNPDTFSLPKSCEEWPLISIVTPSYNQGQFIEETILSVLNQNYPNLQYIVVDAESTDETHAVLERYRDRIDHLIIEPDNGQAEAINKGLRISEGELLAWLNSDDMYAPGALHQIAICWIATRADVIAGICAEHRDKSFALINKPSARARDFSPLKLANIFPNWFNGNYFFQPEAFFTRKILSRAGALDESLHYAMDYDLWMRFALEGAKLEVIHWPCAFFRLHDAQKTAQIVESIAEQCAVRDRYHPLKIRGERMEKINQHLNLLSSKQAPVIAFFDISSNSSLNKFGYAYQLSNYFLLPTGLDDDALGSADAAIVAIGAKRQEIPLIQELRIKYPNLLLIGWFLELEYHSRANHEAALLVDVIVPVDARTGAYLSNESALMMPAIRPHEIGAFIKRVFRSPE